MAVSPRAAATCACVLARAHRVLNHETTGGGELPTQHAQAVVHRCRRVRHWRGVLGSGVRRERRAGSSSHDKATRAPHRARAPLARRCGGERARSQGEPRQRAAAQSRSNCHHQSQARRSFRVSRRAWTLQRERKAAAWRRTREARASSPPRRRSRSARCGAVPRGAGTAHHGAALRLTHDHLLARRAPVPGAPDPGAAPRPRTMLTARAAP